MHKKEAYMREAIALSIESVHEGGGPFGAVIVDEKGEVIGRGKNRVTIHHDPTAHGEIVAIRDACKNTERNDLTGCTLYTSAEPCPGCLVESVFHSNIKEIYYGNTVTDATRIGFADDVHWHIIGTTAQEMTHKAGGTLTQMLHDEALVAFDMWRAKLDKVEYYKA